jgi:hypothetical protein
MTQASQPKRLPSKVVESTPFPVPARLHGSEMVTITVGESSKWSSRTFTVHRNLLHSTSDYFKDKIDALEAKDLDEELELELPRDCPVAFEVAYHWLYSRNIYERPFYMCGTTMSYSLFWLEVYMFSGRRDFVGIHDKAFRKLRQTFNSKTAQFPSRDFIARLYQPSCKELLLQKYLVCHTAFWLLERSTRDEWITSRKSFEAEEGRFILRVAGKLAEWCNNGDPSSLPGHPCGYPPSFFTVCRKTTSPASNRTKLANLYDTSTCCDLLTPTASSSEYSDSD